MTHVIGGASFGPRANALRFPPPSRRAPSGGGGHGAGRPRRGVHRRVRQDVRHGPHGHPRGDGAGPRHHRQGGNPRPPQRPLLRAGGRQPRLREGEQPIRPELLPPPRVPMLTCSRLVQYDQYKTPMENIGLQDSLLSRFDLLFIVLDQMDAEHDREISDHVLRMHRYRDPREQEGAGAVHGRRLAGRAPVSACAVRLTESPPVVLFSDGVWRDGRRPGYRRPRRDRGGARGAADLREAQQPAAREQEEAVGHQTCPPRGEEPPGGLGLRRITEDVLVSLVSGTRS